MSLFGPIYVTATLTLSAKQNAALQTIADSTASLDASVKALLAKLDTPDVPPDLEAASTQLGITTEALRAALAAQPPTS